MTPKEKLIEEVNRSAMAGCGSFDLSSKHLEAIADFILAREEKLAARHEIIEKVRDDRARELEFKLQTALEALRKIDKSKCTVCWSSVHAEETIAAIESQK